MDARTVNILRKLNERFYSEHAASFSQTRQAPWQGWKQCLEIMRTNRFARQASLCEAGHKDPRALSVFDLACGNLRFEAFLSSEMPSTKFSFYAVDSCDLLVSRDSLFTSELAKSTFTYQNHDIITALQAQPSFNKKLALPLCDLSVSFGFMHHVPLQANRAELLNTLIAQTCAGGYVIVSFWQFMKHPKQAEKALAAHARAVKELDLHDLDINDYILDWQNIPKAYRYCHNFSEDEIDELLDAVATKTTLMARFTQDGKTKDLNSYVVLRVA